MKRAIITGATGAIGTALIKKLIAEDIEVLVFTRKSSSRNSNIINHPLVNVKYCDLSQLDTVKNDTGLTYDVFYHFAWAGTTGSGRNDMYLQNLNIKYALDAVKAAKEFGCSTFVGVGSQAEYGRFEGNLTHNTPVFPQTGYGYAKLCAGLMTRDYAHQLGLSHIWVRVLSVYGPNDGMQSMVMSTISKFKDGITPEFTMGEQKWDYLYSDDAADAFYRIGKRGIDSKTYILGSGKAEPLKNYIYTIRDIVSPNATVKLGAIPYSNNQVMYLCADINELTKDTGWTPTTEFAEGIQNIINDLKL